MEMAELRERVERILGGRPLDAFGIVPRALVGFEAAAATGDAQLIRLAVEKLRAGDRLLPTEARALEVGLRMARPAVIIERGRLPETLALDEPVRAAITAQLPGIASVGWGSELLLGTAFQVAPRVLVTSAHVAGELWNGEKRALPVARFDADGEQSERIVPIERVMSRHPLEDVAFLELASPGPLERGLRLSQEPRIASAHAILAVGYPLSSDDQPSWVVGFFENVFGVKRSSPGEVLGREGMRLFHDCTTLPGSSGSPLFDALTGAVVGIHTSGCFAWRNAAVDIKALHTMESLRSRISIWE